LIRIGSAAGVGNGYEFSGDELPNVALHLPDSDSQAARQSLLIRKHVIEASGVPFQKLQTAAGTSGKRHVGIWRLYRVRY